MPNTILDIIPNILYYPTNPRNIHYFQGDGRRCRRNLYFTDWPEKALGMARRNSPRDYMILVLQNADRYKPKRRSYPNDRQYSISLKNYPIGLNSSDVTLLKKPTLEEICQVAGIEFPPQTAEK